MADAPQDLVLHAQQILRDNDQGGYTVPTQRLYPFQWNWDSGFVALGFSTFDEPRAWTEIELLFKGQWEDGLLPHIVFHKVSPDYFPGPGVWGVDRQPQTSGITQPPVVASVVKRLLDGAKDRRPAEEKARALFPKLLAYHRWWWRARDPEKTGLVVIYHPWESGMDNSPSFDKALARVPQTENRNYVRRDTSHVDQAQRPRQAEYDRYMYLVELFRGRGYDPDFMYRESPFRVADLCVNAVLQRATEDLADLAGRFGSAEERQEIAEHIEQGRAGFERLWDEVDGRYYSRDMVSDEPVKVGIAGSFLPLYAGVPTPARAERLRVDLARWGEAARYLVPSTDPAAPTFERQRYWRGPVWAVVNFMIADGLARYGFTDLAERVTRDTRALIEQGDFYEYFDPIDGTAYGGGSFSWTAAMYLYWAGRP
jgi:alpha,alpha-trehalase